MALAGFLVPMPIMALDMLIGLLQAYIFTVLSVYIGAAISSGRKHDRSNLIAIVSIAAAALTMALGAVAAALGESRIGRRRWMP